MTISTTLSLSSTLPPLARLILRAPFFTWSVHEWGKQWWSFVRRIWGLGRYISMFRRNRVPRQDCRYEKMPSAFLRGKLCPHHRGALSLRIGLVDRRLSSDRQKTSLGRTMDVIRIRQGG